MCECVCVSHLVYPGSEFNKMTFSVDVLLTTCKWTVTTVDIHVSVLQLISAVPCTRRKTIIVIPRLYEIITYSRGMLCMKLLPL